VVSTVIFLIWGLYVLNEGFKHSRSTKQQKSPKNLYFAEQEKQNGKPDCPEST
jgi:hypothetical protein